MEPEKIARINELAKKRKGPEGLTPEEEARAREACSKLGDGLREKAYKAMCASMRLQKTQARENGEARP